MSPTDKQVAAYERQRRLARIRFWTGGQQQKSGSRAYGDCLDTRRSAYRSAFQARCKKNGWTVEDVARALEAQKFCCAICRYSFLEDNDDSWEMDHCHRTGRFRGLLCYCCNRALAAFRDDLFSMFEFFANIKRAARYLGADDRKEPIQSHVGHSTGPGPSLGRA